MSKGTVLWVGPRSSGSRELVEETAGEFQLAVRFCGLEELRDIDLVESDDLVGLELGVPPESTLAALRELHARLPQLAIFAASSDTSDGIIRAALAAGANDFLALPINRQELYKALIKFSQTATEAGAKGVIITIYGARSGLGATTIAVNLAVRIGMLIGSDVGLVDLDLQRGDVSAFLNLKPTHSFAALAATPGGVDEVFLQQTLTRHPSGVSVLAAPGEIEEADSIGREQVDVVFRLLRARFRYTVVDTARTLTDATLAAFEQSERLLVLTDLSVPGVRAGRRALELCSRLGTSSRRVDLLVKEVVPRAIKRREASSAIGKEPLAVIPHDRVIAGQAMNAGTPLNGSGPSALTSVVTELASKITGVPVRRRGRRVRILRRFFERKGAARATT